jgi:hypothetical protein
LHTLKQFNAVLKIKKPATPCGFYFLLEPTSGVEPETSALPNVLSAANESIYHSGSAFEAEYHKGRVAAVEQLLVKLGVPQPVVEGLKVEACQDYE